MSDSSRLSNRAGSSPALPPPPPPPAPPLQQSQRYSNRAASALARFAQPFLSGSRPPSPHTRVESGGLRSTRSQSLPGASQTVTHKTGIPIAALDISPGRTHAVIGGKEILKTIRVSPDHSSEEFNIRNAVVSYSSTHHVTGGVSARLKDQLTVRDVKWSHGDHDTIIATAVANGRIFIYDLHRAGLELSRFQGHSRQVHRLAFNPHYPSWLLSGSQDATIRMWDLRMASAERAVSTCGSKEQYIGNSDAIRDIRWSPSDGVLFATATDSGAIQLWDYRRTSAPLMRIAAHDKPCYAVDWHPGGKHLVSGGTDRQVKVWDFSPSAERRQKPTFQFRTPQAVVNVRWRPPSWTGESQGSGDWQCTQVVVSYDKEDPRVHLWDLRRPHIPFREFDRYDSHATDLLWHSKDLLWTVGEAGAFTQTDIRYAPQVVNQRPMCSVAWSPTGDVLAFVQKRPRRRGLAFSTTEFLGSQEEESSSGEKLSSQSPEDDALDEAILTSSLRHRYSKSSSVRPSKSLSATPPSTEELISVLPLETSLSKGKASEPHQTGAMGGIPGATMDSAVFRYLARHYSPLMQDSKIKEGHQNALASLLESFDQNAERAEDASLFKLAQTWKIVKFAVLQELQLRAKEQRRSPDKGNAIIRKRMSRDGAVSEKLRAADEGRHDKMKSRLFKGVMEIEAHKSLLPDVESTSNMTTPLAQPLPDSPIGSHDSSSSRIPDDLGDFQPLPPSVLSSNYGTMNSNELALSDLEARSVAQPRRRQSRSSEDAFMPSESPTSDRMRELIPQEVESDQRSAPRAITGRADWRIRSHPDYTKATSEDDYDQKMEDKRAAIRDYKLFPKKVLSLESPVESTKQPVHGRFPRRESSESFQMFSASTDSSHPAKSLGASFSSTTRLMDVPGFEMVEENSSPNSAKGGTGSPLASELVRDGEGIPREITFDELLPNSNNVHLERPSSPPLLLTESSPIDNDNPPHVNGAASVAKNTGRLILPGVAVDLSAICIPMSPNLTESKPWSVEVILREAIRHYHSSTPVDAQSAAHLLHKLHVFFGECDTILPYEERELLLKIYNEHLLRQSMYVEAAELRQFCVPSYPAVYEYAQTDSFINVFCFTCKRPYENPRRDNSRCYRCNTPQQPCVICMCVDPPSEWVAESSSLVGDPAADEPESETSSGLSTTSNSTDPITPSELQRLDLDGNDSFTASRPKGSALWTWCQGCGHGGHFACISTWLGDISISDGGCATPGCMHDCGPGPRREQNRAALLEESKRRDSVSRKAGMGFVKRDTWAKGESKAVEKVRGMLGVASAGGTSASTTSTGPAGTSSGMMSPKKVRLVTPSEQGKRRAGSARAGSSGLGSRDRESQSDPMTAT